MWSEDELVEMRKTVQAQLEAIRMQSEAIRETARMQRDTAALFHRMFQAARSDSLRLLPDDAPVSQHEHVPVPANPKHRTYEGFRQAMIELEHQLLEGQRPTKTNICAYGADTPKTITRTMTRCYQLRANQWPPSTWPEQAPAG